MTHNHSEPVQTEAPDITAEQRARLKELFPEAFTEGKVDFEKLRATLGDFVDDGPERYRFTWAGKRDAIRMLQMPTRATLVPCREESLNFDETQHIFIEGDNLEVLKLLYKPYFGRVKMIYIDPPYNTGHDFIYPDNYADPLGVYLQLTGQQDAEGNLLTSNPETSGRYHSAWLSMMYPRLFLARQLLREDGAVWISIDDVEAANLRVICNEIFGEENFVATFIWEKRTTRENRRVFSFNHDFILCYARNKDFFQVSRNLLPLSEEVLKRYSNPDNDPRGDWQSISLNAQAGHATPAQFYTIVTPGGRELAPPPGRCWSVTKERLQELIADNRVWFGLDGNNVPRLKVFLSETRGGLTPHTLWKADEVGTNDSAKKALIELFAGEAVYDTPKPVGLIKRIVQISTMPSEQDIILDFFAGSCTASQAVLELNREDGGNRRFIMVQLPEPTDNPEFPTIADIGKERIRRVIAQMQQEREGQLPLDTRETPEDLGFKVFKLAPSNYRPWRGVDEHTPEAYEQQMALFLDPLVDGWTVEDVIYEVALKDRGYGLNCRIESLGTVRDPAQPGQPPPRNVVYRITDPDKEQSCILCLADKIPPPLVRLLELDTTDAFICRDVALDDETAANLALQCRLKTI